MTDSTTTTISNQSTWDERHDAEQVVRANASGLQPVVFVHGLWLLPASWDRWMSRFEKAGYTALNPGWPDDPETVEEAKANPEAFARKSIGQIADHLAAVVGGLDRRPAIVGHSFGGLLVQILAGRGLSAATVAIDPAPFRGVLPVPASAIKASSSVLADPRNYNRAVALTFDQFKYAFANAVDDDQARRLYEEFAVPGAGRPIFQAVSANLNPWTEAKVDRDNPDRGPMLVISGEVDHQVPRAIAEASYKKQSKNQNVTEFKEIPDRGHSLVIDDGWQEVAETALAFIKRFV